ncbi:MAG: hypothetical protein RR846_06185 [Oscillospiraceae bacterium]
MEKKCSCSDRPLGIISSGVVMEQNKPYQVLEFACTNKLCGQYKKVVERQHINLLDNMDVRTERV